MFAGLVPLDFKHPLNSYIITPSDLKISRQRGYDLSLNLHYVTA